MLVELIENFTICSLNYVSLTWRCCLIDDFITFSFWNCCMTHCHHCQKLTYYRCSWLEKCNKKYQSDYSFKQKLKCNNRWGLIIVTKILMKDFSSLLEKLPTKQNICNLYTNFSMQHNFLLLYFDTGYIEFSGIYYCKNQK